MGKTRVTGPRQPRFVNRWLWAGLAALLLIVLVYRLGFSSAQHSQLGLGEKVGIIRLEGPIFSSEKIVKELDEYGDRSDIKSIVLRINSPGGAVAPSQEIYEKVRSMKGVKPVIVSVGSVAASGGYYAALGAERIVVNQGSITGSIGVIMDYPVAVELLDKIGLRFETVKSGALKDAGSPTREVTESDRAYFQTVIQELHEQFIQAVADNREYAVEAVRDLADGRIFTGSQALELGLVDTLGTLEDAIAIAGELGKISGKPRTVETRKRRSTLLDFIFGDMEQTVSSWFRMEPAYRWRWE